MKRINVYFGLLALSLAVAGTAHAEKDDLDVIRLNNTLSQLANDPVLGSYAQAEQVLARNAINQLAQAKSKQREHDLYIAERRVDLAKTTAQVQASQLKLNQLDREHDQIQLEAARREAEATRQELERQRLQYQAAQEAAQRAQEEGQAATQQAQAEADQAKALAAAQAKAAAAARREAAAAAAAARAMRSQLGDGSGASPSTPTTTHKKKKSSAVSGG